VDILQVSHAHREARKMRLVKWLSAFHRIARSWEIIGSAQLYSLAAVSEQWRGICIEFVGSTGRFQRRASF